MPDVHSKETRSYNMSCIRSGNTKPEEVVRKYLYSCGLRYRKNDKRLLGKPDLVFPKYRTVVFVHGCFWHKHDGCRYFVLPKTNTVFWNEKLDSNRNRDERISTQLRADGWRVLTIWECELKKSVLSESLEQLYRDIIHYC